MAKKRRKTSKHSRAEHLARYARIEEHISNCTDNACIACKARRAQQADRDNKREEPIPEHA